MAKGEPKKLQKKIYTAPEVRNVVSWRTIEEGMPNRFRRRSTQQEVLSSAIGNRAGRLIEEYGNRTGSNGRNPNRSRNTVRIARAAANMARRLGIL